MSISLFSVVILLIFTITAIVEIRQGQRRGFFLSLAFFGTLILSIMCAITLSTHLSQSFISGLLKPMLTAVLIYLTMLSSIASAGGYALTSGFQAIADTLQRYIQDADPTLLSVQNAIASMLSSFLFVGIFLLLRAALNFVAARLIAKKLPTSSCEYPGRNDSLFRRHSKLLGGLMGALMAVIVSMAITAPIMGNLRVIAVANEYLLSTDPVVFDRLGLLFSDLAALHQYAWDLPGSLLYDLGGKYLYQAVAQCRLDGQLFFLADQPLAFATTLSQITPLFVLNYALDISTGVNTLVFLLALVFCPVFYVILTARVLPKQLLIPQAQLSRIQDRGIARYTHPQGRSIVYQPSPAAKTHIPQYVLSDRDGQRFLECKLSPQVQHIQYRIFPFDVHDRPLQCLEVDDPVSVPGISRAVSLPGNTAYVSISVQQVNGSRIPDDGKLAFSWIRVFLYALSVVLLTLLLADIMQQAMFTLLSGIFPDLLVSAEEHGTATPAFLLGAAYAGIVFFCQFKQVRKSAK